MAVYTTKDAELLDQIALRHYGRTDGTVERVLAANFGLADAGPVLPSGLSITLPYLAFEPPRVPINRLWD